MKTIIIFITALMLILPAKAQDFEYVTPERVETPIKGTYYQVGLGFATGEHLFAALDIGRFYYQDRLKAALELSTRALIYQGDKLSDGLSTDFKISGILTDNWKIKPYLGLKGGYVHFLQLADNTFEYGAFGGIEIPLEGNQRLVFNIACVRFNVNDGEGINKTFTPIIFSINLFGMFTKSHY